MPMTPEERTLRAQIAAHTLHSRVDSRVHTEPARRAFLDSFEKKVDPEGVLPVEERRRRAEQAKSAHFKSMALKSAQVRRQR
jgi:hypothetical protein